MTGRGPRFWFFQHGESAESTVFTEKERSVPAGLHQVATQADVDAAHATMCSSLHLMNWQNGGDGLELQDEMAGDG